MSNVFKTLTALNVNEKTEKKGKFTYLSWAWAWDRFVQHYPEATYEIAKNELNLPYFNSDAGAMVYTKVTAGGITHEMWLPIMDSRNQALKTFNMMDVNKTVMRCLVKNLAMFGLGLYIYAGEDLPEEAEETKQQPKKKPSDNGIFVSICKENGVDPKVIAEIMGVTSSKPETVKKAISDEAELLRVINEVKNGN